MSPASPLPFDTRATLYSQLAALENSGLPPLNALTVIRLERAVEPRLEKMRSLLRGGMELPRAGERAGLFTALDAALIHAAWSTGSPGPTYRRLASFYTERAHQLAAMKSRMWFPAAVLVLALMIRPLPQLVTGTLAGGAYAMQVLQPLFALAAIIWLAMRLPRWLRHSPAKPLVERLWIEMPLFGAMHVRRNARDFFESLALMVEAGLPILDALLKAAATVDNEIIRRDYTRMARRVREGWKLGDAVAKLRYAGGERAAAFVRTGEESGALPEMLFRHAGMETEALRSFYEQVSQWVPRLAYAMVAAWMAYGLLTGHGFMPQLPPDLQ